jgi:hypothetical protein
MTEPKYYPGYQAAIDAVSRMNRDQLINQIDALYGRDRISALNSTTEEIRTEALRQTALDWLNPQSEQYEVARNSLA